MRKLIKRTAKDLSSFENYKINNLKIIIGGLGDGDIDPKKPQSGSGNPVPGDGDIR